ncbi:uncharacterized protein LOC21403109 isoform X2 [Morus notabilis]|uniref:uncharacterized protein LOC21403109 isoform X2 n=1 Tax=Morus notabilis TaxID=981085 RepID=UPI000CED4C6E|nr:uncharacterized protein LOC21403109 isoform X2 [Morus notabilis]XP_024026249.1 uncharacterized protein LOC21403109 isoform X2 [Morus notabilis]
MISSRHLKLSQQDNQLRSRPSDDNDDDEDEDDAESQMAVPEQMRIGIAVEEARKQGQEPQEAVDMMEKRLGDDEVPGKQWSGAAKRRVLHGKKTG